VTAEAAVRFRILIIVTLSQTPARSFVITDLRFSSAAIATDADGHVTFWNSSAERHYGWTATEAFGRSLVELTVENTAAEQSRLDIGMPGMDGSEVARRIRSQPE